MITIPRFVFLIFALIFMPIAAQSRAEEPAPADKPAVEKAPSAAGDATGGDKWRFKQHQGMWWYWLPSNSWVYWHDNKWVPYDAESYAKLRASQQPVQVQPQRQRSYSNSNNGESGFWGPVRYNQYGQPQYPYSQRKSGIRQLGPVPAMGGIRSLPGWGGER